MGRLIRRLVVLVVLAGVAYVGYAKVRANGSKGPGWTTVKVSRGDITEKALAVGQIEPRNETRIKSKISGIVKRCLVDVGDKVKRGDPLFEIAPNPTPQELLDVDNSLRQAQARFERAKVDFQRGQALRAKGLMPAGDLDGLREQYNLTSVALEQAKANRELTRKGRVSEGATKVETVIRAPEPGTILSRSVDPGDPVVPLTSYQPGTELASLAEMGDLIFKGTVDEIDVGKIAVGMPCRITVGALPDATVEGRLSRIAPKAEKGEGSTLFDVEIELEPHEGVMLRAGYSANADVIIREKTNVLLLPERLVLFDKDSDATSVEIPGEGEKAEPKKVPVKLGLSDGLNVEIVSGLEENSEVVERPPKEIS